MDDKERRTDAPAAAPRPAVGKDLPYDPQWVADIGATYVATLLDDQSIHDMAKLRTMFQADLKALTNGQGLFINILMQGRRRLEDKYRTIFDKNLGHSGQTDPPWQTDPRVRFNANLVNPVHGSLAATMIHEYTHLATIAVYDNGGEPWPKFDEDEAKRVREKLAHTYPIPEDKGKYLRWEKWLATLQNQTLEGQIRGVLRGFLAYSDDQYDREALPHVVEIIYYLYNAGVSWWTITDGPIAKVADLLVKFTYT
jgi:hypothetical protein